MLLFKTALKNILGSGIRTWLNVAVLSFTFVTVVLFNGLTDGWIQESKQETIAWETGSGQFWMPEYDRYDVFTLQEAHTRIPAELQPYVDKGELTPVLVVQGAAYPQGRMINLQLKGIDPTQQIVHLPSYLLQSDNQEITALIGKRTAKSARLEEGDLVMIRWRDKNGAFDAREVRIAGIFDTKVAAIDAGQCWLRLNDLQQMTGMEGEATYLIQSPHNTLNADTGKWLYKDLDYLLADLYSMLEANQIESVILFIVLLAIALLAVFDTQTLSIFRRQKEIGTYVALGMTQRQVTNLFTLEGTAYSILAIAAGAVWGGPLLAIFAKVGIRMPGMITDTGLPIGDTIYPLYTIQSISICITIIVLASAFISYIPARKIANQNIVNALKGKIS